MTHTVEIDLPEEPLFSLKETPEHFAKEIKMLAAVKLFDLGSISFSVPRLGLVATITILVASQFILGALIDHYGWLAAEIRPFTMQKFAGIGILMFGVWLIIR